MAICLWPNELIIVGTVDDDDDEEDAKVGGNKGLHDEWELTEVLVDVNGTPDDGYKSWLNCKRWSKIKWQIQILISKFHKFLNEYIQIAKTFLLYFKYFSVNKNLIM